MDRLHISEAVLAQLSPDEQRRLAHGDDAQPSYGCVVCGQPGDMRTEDTSLCLIVGIGDTASAAVFAHAACAPSRAYSTRQFRRWAEQHQQARALTAAADVVGPFYTTRAQFAGDLAPVLVIAAEDNLQIISPTGAVQDSVVLQAIQYGFAPAPSGLAWHELPPAVTGWTVHVDAGRLHRITRPGGTWWTWPDDEPLPPLDRAWVEAARPSHHALVLASGVLAADSDEDEFLASLTTMADTSRLAAALVPITGL